MNEQIEVRILGPETENKSHDTFPQRAFVFLHSQSSYLAPQKSYMDVSKTSMGIIVRLRSSNMSVGANSSGGI